MIEVCIERMAPPCYTLTASVRASVRDSVWGSVRASVGDSVGASVRASVGDSVGASVRASVRDSVWGSVWDSVYGQHDAPWLSLYGYYLEVCDLTVCQKLLPLMSLAENCGWWIPYEDIAILQEKTQEVHLNDRGLHREDGPAVLYPDGFSVYSLNGVRVSQEIVETPADKLDCQLVLKEKNAEIRREIVRKIGIERLLEDLNSKVLDTWNGYELLELDLKDGRRRPYLKMINPSIGTIHVEGVEPSIKTCQEALAWRTGQEGKYIEPRILT